MLIHRSIWRPSQQQDTGRGGRLDLLAFAPQHGALILIKPKLARLQRAVVA